MRSILLVLLIVLPPVVVAAVMRGMDTPKRFAVVESGRLYRGAFPTSRQLHNLAKEHHIRTVVSLTSDDGSPREKELETAVREMKLTRHRFAMEGDGTGDLKTLDGAADALATVKEQPIFFHCAAGDKRSSAALGAYWMKHEGKSLGETLDDLARDYGIDVNGDGKPLAGQLHKYAVYLGHESKATTAPAGKD